MNIVIKIVFGVDIDIQDEVYRNINIRFLAWARKSTLPTLILVEKINMDYYRTIMAHNNMTIKCNYR